MAFSVLFFLFVFLPVFLAVYSFIPWTQFRGWVLFIGSLIFYGWADPYGVLLLLIVSGWIWASGLAVERAPENRRKFTFWSSIAFLLVILLFYKYVDFWLGSVSSLLGLNLPLLGVTMPLGLSFYIFSAISYIADIYMGKARAQTSFLSAGLFIALFAKVTMGPSVQYHDFADQLNSRRASREEIGEGWMRFVKGLAKKVIIADQLALAFTMMGADNSFLGAWVASLAYTFQLYFDFSGYTDMAIGLGTMFGFSLPENFDHPYIADSVQNFWRRWHISLSRWFRDYVYIPLGGSRVIDLKYIRNILIVWLLTGLWHGPSMNFIVWGLYYGLLLLAEKFFYGKYLEKLPHWVRVVLIFLVANTGWIFFSHASFTEGLALLGRTVGIGASSFASLNSLFVLKSYLFVFVLAAVFSRDVFGKLQDFVLIRLRGNGMAVMAGFYVLLFVISVCFMVASTSQTFLYFAF